MPFSDVKDAEAWYRVEKLFDADYRTSVFMLKGTAKQIRRQSEVVEEIYGYADEPISYIVAWYKDRLKRKENNLGR